MFPAHKVELPTGISGFSFFSFFFFFFFFFNETKWHLTLIWSQNELAMYKMHFKLEQQFTNFLYKDKIELFSIVLDRTLISYVIVEQKFIVRKCLTDFTKTGRDNVY